MYNNYKISYTLVHIYNVDRKILLKLFQILEYFSAKFQRLLAEKSISANRKKKTIEMAIKDVLLIVFHRLFSTFSTLKKIF